MVHQPFGGGFIEFLARDALHHVMGKRIQKRLYCLRHDEVECFTGLCQFPCNELIMPNKRFIKYWRI